MACVPASASMPASMPLCLYVMYPNPPTPKLLCMYVNVCRTYMYMYIQYTISKFPKSVNLFFVSRIFLNPAYICVLYTHGALNYRLHSSAIHCPGLFPGFLTTPNTYLVNTQVVLVLYCIVCTYIQYILDVNAHTIFSCHFLQSFFQEKTCLRRT